MFKKFTWGHGVIVALGLFMIFILSMIFFFTRGWQNAEEISDNYYADQLAYQDVIDAKNNADALPEKPVYSESAEGITITFPTSITVDERKVNFILFRTDDAKLDVKKELILNDNRQVLIPSKIIFRGSYTLKIEWKQNNQPYQIDYDVQWK